MFAFSRSVTRSPAAASLSCLSTAVSTRRLAASRSSPFPLSRRIFQTPTPIPRRSLSQGPPPNHDAYTRLQNAKPLFSSSSNKSARRRIRLPSIRAIAIGSMVGAAVFWAAHLERVPISGRLRFNCFPEQLIARLCSWQARELEQEIESQGGRFLPEWDPRTRLVKKVMSRLIPVSGGGRLVDSTTPPPGEERRGPPDATATEGALGNSDEIQWEIRVIDDPDTANAFVLPGGKVFVHSGILRATRNEAGLAAVLGHEIAHNMASHVAERISYDLGPNIVLYTSFLLSFGAAIFMFSMFGGMKSILISMPMSRKQESEADYIGLMLMAEACYDPREAVEFWRRMSWFAQQQGQQPPELLSTHPSNETRIEMIQQWMPEAMEKWESSSCHGTSTFADAFRRAKEMGVWIL